MTRLIYAYGTALFFLLNAVGTANAGSELTKVEFPSLDGKTDLDAYFQSPHKDGLIPAVIFLHGCSGIGVSGTISNTYRAWANLMVGHGYAVLIIDSASPRGFGSTCGKSDRRKMMYFNRPKDAYGGLKYLQSRTRIDPKRIGLIGWSQGGGIALLTIVTESIGRPVPPPRHDFRAAVAFYPSACSNVLQHRPYTTVKNGTWATVAPILVLHGEADNWTPIGPCYRFIEGIRKRGQPARIAGFPGAAHSFDAPNLKLTRRSAPRLKDGSLPMVGTNPAARAKAMEMVPKFFADFMK